MSGGIQQLWFADGLNPAWKPENDQSFNGFFHAQLNQLRAAYQLRPIKFGLDRSNYLRPVTARGREAYAMLEELNWTNMIKETEQTLLVFELELSLNLQIQGESAFKEALWAPLDITFPATYPHRKPIMRVDKDRRSNNASPFKWDMEEYICTMNSDKDWRVNVNDSMLNAVDSLVDWLAANYFGQGPDYLEGQ